MQPIEYFLVVWFTLAAGSTAYVAWDIGTTPNPR
jgi:hypothetical protein